MKYDLSKIGKEVTVKLQWHGEPTRVMIKGQGTKTDVNTGDTIEVGKEQAKQLLKYSSNWTMENDTPVNHAYKPESTPKAEKTKAKEVKKDQKDLTKTEIIAELKRLKVSFNDKATVEELRSLLNEVAA